MKTRWKTKVSYSKLPHAAEFHNFFFTLFSNTGCISLSVRPSAVALCSLNVTAIPKLNHTPLFHNHSFYTTSLLTAEANDSVYRAVRPFAMTQAVLMAMTQFDSASLFFFPPTRALTLCCGTVWKVPLRLSQKMILCQELAWRSVKALLGEFLCLFNVLQFIFPF